jgi:hypothetical protein
MKDTGSGLEDEKRINQYLIGPEKIYTQQRIELRGIIL